MNQKDKTKIRKMCEKIFGIQINSVVYTKRDLLFFDSAKIGKSFNMKSFTVHKGRKGIVVKIQRNRLVDDNLMLIDFGSPYGKCHVGEKDVTLWKVTGK